MRILISGASGLIGRALATSLAGGGHEIVRLVRHPRNQPGTVFWDPIGSTVEVHGLGGLDAAVHLAGESLGVGRWTEARKARIYDSRVAATKLLAQTLAQLDPPPQTLITASAIGFYGDREAELMTESSPPGAGFLAEVCRAWEAATTPASARGIRVVQLRIGVVLTAHGGALAQMLRPFRLGLGGVVGSGEQFISWIALPDLVAAIEHVLGNPDLHGPLNAVSPHPVTQREFARTLGYVLRRPTVLPLPAFLARLLFGEVADEMLLASIRVDANRLLHSGFQFRYPELEGALRALLAR